MAGNKHYRALHQNLRNEPAKYRNPSYNDVRQDLRDQTITDHLKVLLSGVDLVNKDTKINQEYFLDQSNLEKILLITHNNSNIVINGKKYDAVDILKILIEKNSFNFELLVPLLNYAKNSDKVSAEVFTFLGQTLVDNLSKLNTLDAQKALLSIEDFSVNGKYYTAESLVERLIEARGREKVEVDQLRKHAVSHNGRYMNQPEQQIAQGIINALSPKKIQSTPMTGSDRIALNARAANTSKEITSLTRLANDLNNQLAKPNTAHPITEKVQPSAQIKKVDYLGQNNSIVANRVKEIEQAITQRPLNTEQTAPRVPVRRTVSGVTVTNTTRKLSQDEQTNQFFALLKEKSPADQKEAIEKNPELFIGSAINSPAPLKNVTIIIANTNITQEQLEKSLAIAKQMNAAPEIQTLLNNELTFARLSQFKTDTSIAVVEKQYLPLLRTAIASPKAAEKVKLLVEYPGINPETRKAGIEATLASAGINNQQDVVDYLAQKTLETATAQPNTQKKVATTPTATPEPQQVAKRPGVKTFVAYTQKQQKINGQKEEAAKQFKLAIQKNRIKFELKAGNFNYKNFYETTNALKAENRDILDNFLNELKESNPNQSLILDLAKSNANPNGKENGKSGYSATVRRLARIGVDLNQQDADKKTAMHIAVDNNNANLVSAISQAYAHKLVKQAVKSGYSKDQIQELKAEFTLTLAPKTKELSSVVNGQKRNYADANAYLAAVDAKSAELSSELKKSDSKEIKAPDATVRAKIPFAEQRKILAKNKELLAQRNNLSKQALPRKQPPNQKDTHYQDLVAKKLPEEDARKAPVTKPSAGSLYVSPEYLRTAGITEGQLNDKAKEARLREKYSIASKESKASLEKQ